MFIRLKTRKCSQDDVLISAVLVESIREDGKVRQKVVKYLGSIHLLDLKLDLITPAGKFRRSVLQAGQDLGLSRNRQLSLFYSVDDEIFKRFEIRMNSGYSYNQEHTDRQRLESHCTHNIVGTTERRKLFKRIVMQEN